MPSLRRSASSPLVRSSPYSSSSSLSALAARARENRRSAASETSGRRVLADIDWWRVTEGQCDPNLDDADDGNRVVIGDFPTSVDVGVEHPSSLLPLPWVTTTSEDVPETFPVLPTAQFAALSIAPSTPPRHGRDSSVESSPEIPQSSLEDTSSELDMGFFDAPLPPLPRFRRGPRRTLAPALGRSFTFADTHSLRIESPSHYADFAISPLSSAPDFLN